MVGRKQKRTDFIGKVFDTRKKKPRKCIPGEENPENAYRVNFTRWMYFLSFLSGIVPGLNFFFPFSVIIL